MKDIKKDIEQLEFAGELIDKNSPTTSRLALFLIDNLAELIMYRNVMREFLQDEQRGKQYILAIPKKYSMKKENKVKQYFKDKVNFLVNDLKKISESDGWVLRVGHYLRSESYHIGILRERIIVPITRTYFQTICKIFPSIWRGGYSYTNYEEVTEFLRKYGIEEGSIDHNVLAKICSNMLRGRDCKELELAKVISEDLVTRIQETLEGLEYLASDPNAEPPDEILKWMQFRKEGRLESIIAKTKDEEFHSFSKMVKDKLAVFRPKVTLDTLKEWIKKAKAIKHERDRVTILSKFWEIDKQFLPIENFVLEAVVEYDMEINSQIHEL